MSLRKSEGSHGQFGPDSAGRLLLLGSFSSAVRVERDRRINIPDEIGLQTSFGPTFARPTLFYGFSED